MSPALKNDNPWWKQNYEQLILLVIIAALVASSALLVMRLQAQRSEQRNARWALPEAQQAGAQALDPQLLQQQLKDLRSQVVYDQYANRMLVSEQRVSCIHCGKPIPYLASTCGFCGTEQPAPPNPDIDDRDADGMPDKFEEDHGLNPDDRDDAGLDKDADGFTNLEEYRAGTALDNAEVYPPLSAKLRLLGTRAEPFVLRFTAVSRLGEDSPLRFQLNLRTLSRTYFAKVGDTINDPANGIRDIQVLEFLPDAPAGPTLILQKGADRIPLVKGKAINDFEWVANVAFLIERRRFVVRLHDVIELRDQTYKVIDINRDTVLLRNADTGEQSQVNPITQAELDTFRGIDRSMMDDGMMTPEGTPQTGVLGAP